MAEANSRLNSADRRWRVAKAAAPRSPDAVEYRRDEHPHGIRVAARRRGSRLSQWKAEILQQDDLTIALRGVL